MGCCAVAMILEPLRLQVRRRVGRYVSAVLDSGLCDVHGVGPRSDALRRVHLSGENEHYRKLERQSGTSASCMIVSQPGTMLLRCLQNISCRLVNSLPAALTREWHDAGAVQHAHRAAQHPAVGDQRRRGGFRLHRQTDSLPADARGGLTSVSDRLAWLSPGCCKFCCGMRR